MIIFMDRVLQTPPSWLSMPSRVPLDVAAGNRNKLALAVSIDSAIRSGKATTKILTSCLTVVFVLVHEP